MRELQLREEDRERLAAAQWLPAVGPFTAFGRSWTVQTDEPELAALLKDLYADLSVVTGATRLDATFRVVANDVGRISLVTRDEVRLGGGHTPPATMSALTWAMNRWVLHEASQDHLLLHAGGLVRDDGVALLLPAPSGSGKSTLTMGLLDRGFAYLSDEAIAISSDGTLEGYARPLSINRGSWQVLSRHRPELSSIGAAYLERQWHIRASNLTYVVPSARLGAIIFPRFDPSTPARMVLQGATTKVLLASRSTFAPGSSQKVQLHQIRGLIDSLADVPAYELLSSDLRNACDAAQRVLEGHVTPQAPTV